MNRIIRFATLFVLCLVGAWIAGVLGYAVAFWLYGT